MPYAELRGLSALGFQRLSRCQSSIKQRHSVWSQRARASFLACSCGVSIFTIAVLVESAVAIASTMASEDTRAIRFLIAHPSDV